ncbi:hypothetical protein FRC12_024843 [Ceratobasidium sp. 428]|nr:hypothetical protein FRC12_024843 [Ceratobasidium sp. 428]
MPISLRFCSLKTGLAHPLASKPVITLLLGFRVNDVFQSATSLQTTEDLLILELFGSEYDSTLSDPVCDVLTIDWRVGTVLLRLGTPRGTCAPAYLGRNQSAMFTFNVSVLGAERARSNSIKLLIYNLVRTPILEGLSLGCRSLDPAYSPEFPTLMDDIFFGPNAIVVNPVDF